MHAIGMRAAEPSYPMQVFLMPLFWYLVSCQCVCRLPSAAQVSARSGYAHPDLIQGLRVYLLKTCNPPPQTLPNQPIQFICRRNCICDMDGSFQFGIGAKLEGWVFDKRVAINWKRLWESAGLFSRPFISVDPLHNRLSEGVLGWLRMPYLWVYPQSLNALGLTEWRGKDCK